MKSRIALCLKVVWLTTSALVLLLGTNNCVASNEACFIAGETMFFWMFALSFPASILGVLVALIFLGPNSGNDLSTYITLWLFLTCGGYLQWFILAPRLFADRDLTILNLRPEVKPLQRSTFETKVEQPASKVEGIKARVKPVRKPRQVKRIAAFDRHGRTPLERALGPRS